MNYTISDTHFYHNNIINYCDRPFKNTTEMNNYIIEKWNQVVKEDDTIYHLGDFAIGWDKENYQTKKECYKDLMTKLNGNKILIKGNHDWESNNFYLDIGFKEVYDYLIINNNLLIHYPIIINKKSLSYIKDELKLFLNQFNIDEYRNIFHGHIHNSNYKPKKHINVSIENINYTPLCIDEYIKEIF